MVSQRGAVEVGGRFHDFGAFVGFRLRGFRLTVLDSLGLAVFTRLRSESGSLQ